MTYAKHPTVTVTINDKRFPLRAELGIREGEASNCPVDVLLQEVRLELKHA